MATKEAVPIRSHFLVVHVNTHREIHFQLLPVSLLQHGRHRYDALSPATHHLPNQPSLVLLQRRRKRQNGGSVVPRKSKEYRLR